MTITSTEKRSAQRFDHVEEIAPNLAAASPPAGFNPPLATTSVADSARIPVEAEEPEQRGSRTDWMTLFARAKTLGGW